MLAVGSASEIASLAGPVTRTIDLKGAFVSPGFNDAHVHIDSTGSLLVGVNLLEVHEPGAFTEAVTGAASRLPPGSWITRGDWGAYEQWNAGSAGTRASRRRWASFEEHMKGTITPGRLADLAVFDTNLVEVGRTAPAQFWTPGCCIRSPAADRVSAVIQRGGAQDR